MDKKDMKKVWINLFVGVLILSFILTNTGKVLSFIGNDSTTQTWLDFYSLKKDSLDVVYLGSSHMLVSLRTAPAYVNYL